MANERNIAFLPTDTDQKRASDLNYWMATTAYAPGSFTVADGSNRIGVKRLTLRGSERATLRGDSRMVFVG